MNFTEKENLMMRVNHIITSRMNRDSHILGCDMRRQSVIQQINREVNKLINNETIGEN